MKKKIFLFASLLVLLVCFLAISISADSVHSGRVDLNATVTLSDGTTLNLFDSNGNALIWYIDSNSETGYSSVRADSGAGEEGYTGGSVVFNQSYQFNVGNKTVGVVTAYEVNKLTITVNGTSFDDSNIVVFNVMDDDVLTSKGNSFNCFRDIFNQNSNLQYAYLRLDTVALQANALTGCKNLKYINIEDITELRQLGGSQPIGGCTSLFKGENKVLDLTRTKLTTMNGSGAFSYVPVVGIKLPKTLTELGEWNIQGTAVSSFVFPEGVATIAGSQFNDCTQLKEIYINNTTTKIIARAFNNTALEKVFYVGTLEQLNALLDNTDFANNKPLTNVIGENRANLISYANYLSLEDKSGNYVVYDFNYCVAYNEGNHTIPEAPLSPCAWLCDVCGNATINHVEGNLEVTASYVTYDKAGVKETKCLNEGCNHIVKETLAPLFESKGFSTTIYGKGGIAICFAVNNEAISVYEGLIDSKINFGVFAGLYDTVYAKEIINAEDGTAVAGAIRSDMTSKGYDLMELKISGFMNDAQKAKQIVIGAYVIVGKDVSYLQNSSAGEGNKYSSVSFNSLASQI